MSKQPEALALAEVNEHLANRSKTDGEKTFIVKIFNDNAAELRRLHEVNAELVEALKDMWGGWKYIREVHGDLYGVGWDRAESKAQAAIAKGESNE